VLQTSASGATGACDRCCKRAQVAPVRQTGPWVPRPAIRPHASCLPVQLLLARARQAADVHFERETYDRWRCRSRRASGPGAQRRQSCVGSPERPTTPSLRAGRAARAAHSARADCRDKRRVSLGQRCWVARVAAAVRARWHNERTVLCVKVLKVDPLCRRIIPGGQCAGRRCCPRRCCGRLAWY
jgi:hypothetical protein